ncbi:polysaccharide deacetylase family protein [Terasakiella pusilla]|uniref:polysaccharide deacetylase family protein n=1 Tax=Terasakiella pusilla TaxID=64973 RepID=UPI003AA9A46A
MALDKSYLEYPKRAYGHDHDFYDWSMLTDRPKVTWPDGKKLAVWINTTLEFYPLNQRNIPFKTPNGMTMPYPDLRHFSLREYGNRVGIFRLLEAYKKFGITSTFAINTHLAEKNPYLLNRLLKEEGEILCHGWNMDHLHYGGQDLEEERALVKKSVDRLRELSGQPVRGWLSPAKNQSENTMMLLAENGIDYCCDWINDDMPYEFKTPASNLHVMPLSTEIEDQFVLGNNLHSEDSWAQQVIDAFDYLLAEANEQGGRLFALNLHPWLIGQPHRIGCVEKVLAHIAASDDIWQANAGDILDSFKGQS